MKRKKIILYTLLVLLAAGAAGGYYFYTEYNRQHKDTATSTPDFTATADSFLADFTKDENAANARYLGKVLEVKGLVKELLKDDKGFYSVVVGDTAAMSSVRCSMDSIHNQEAAALARGMQVTLKGVCSGYNADELLGSDLILNRSALVAQ